MSTPILGMRFSVLFMVGGVVPNPIDLRFAKVSGLEMRVETETVTDKSRSNPPWPTPH